jgi:hypothetical protein
MHPLLRGLPAFLLLLASLPFWFWRGEPQRADAAPAAQVFTPTPVRQAPSPNLVTPTPLPSPTVVAPPVPTPVVGPTPTAPPLPPAPAERLFPQTGFAVRNDRFWEFFNSYGGVRTFGYPISREFQFLGFPVQFFQRQIMQQWPDGSVHTMNLLDDLMPYTRINGSVFPEVNVSLKDRTPDVGSPNYATAIVQFVQQNAPEEWRGLPVRYWTTFRTTVPGTENDPLFNLNVWGAPISEPAYDPSNQGFVYGRWQRGIMHFDVTCMCTQGLLLADWFRAVLTGQGLPPDLAGQAQGSRFYIQYNNVAETGLNRPAELPGTNMRFAFEPEQPPR